MKYYKFRSLENFEYTIDILLNKRLYASDFRKLNDPMEGAFKLLPEVDIKLREAIIEKKESLKVCSLSERMNNPLMWAHYANNFKGICIELELNNYSLEKVNYEYDILKVTNDLIGSNDWAKKILTTKFMEWEYEKEFRILANNDYVENIEITAIYLGTRISENHKQVLENIVTKDIIYNTRINENNEVVKSSKGCKNGNRRN